ncbi:Gfo/Idh/MocA family oxidoreductase [Pseudomonas putida]|uniref:Gfo/Idh/MocA family oxidoreductase n=1 Tax=Pseudomonas putida TaxID=303 RepID=A0A4D6XCS8_PSEPU|nr:Gfo/Idh/MocA family oxidoreductase [Pseudomonas putida]QCI13514.1 Gfo/Idh/MocA family oxidoreductase [Pseudomonas putida]
MTRVVILGAGMIAEVHRRAALAAGAHIVGVMASNAARTQSAADRWGVPPVLSLQDLKEVAADVVHVCSPNALHLEHVKAAITAGAHVICEKPLATRVTDAESLQLLSVQRRRVGTVPFVYRYHPLVRELRARVHDGEFGRWQLLHGSYLQDWMLSPRVSNWRVDARNGGPSRAFADIGSHWCDLMEFVTGERIASVMASFSVTVAERPVSSAVSFTHGDPVEPVMTVNTEDAASVMFRTESGVLGAVVISQVSAGRKNRLWFEFDGAQKSAVFDQENPETVWLGSQTSNTILARDPGQGSADARRLSSLPAGHAQGYAQCFEHFVADTYAAINGEVREGLPTFVDGLRAARIAEAVIESARSEQWVAVSRV